MTTNNSFRDRGVLLLIFTIFYVGCSRQAEIRYESAAEVGELPELHQQQIRDALRRYYGTASHPTLRIPDLDMETEDGEVALVNVIEPDRLRHGAEVYNRRCAGCHGYTGDGRGVAAEYLNPRPRDYRLGKFKFTSTPYGFKPRKADLVRVIRKGAKGTSMPSFPWISDEDVSAVADYIIALSQRGELEQHLIREAGDFGPEEAIEPEIIQDDVLLIHRQWQQAADQIVMPVTTQPKRTEATIQQGRQAFLSKGCSKCHGPDGRGQTEWLSPKFIAEQEALPERIKINFDAWGQPAPAANIAAGMLHGGRRPLDIYRRIYAGINGTPMPAFSQALAEEPDTIWHLVHYVQAVQSGREFDNPPLADERAAGEPAEQPVPADAAPAADVADGTENESAVEAGAPKATETTADDESSAGGQAKEPNGESNGEPPPQASNDGN